jgi:hypothetical protein
VFEVEKKLKKANVPSTIRFTEELYKDLHKVANRYGVSFNLLVLQCCKYALENMKEKE